jgi:Fur family ferric uptake transcriptional regulator
MNPDTSIDNIVIDVTKRFASFLENNNYRKTHERFAILEEIYRNQTHFDAETLYVQMKKSAYRVSRATVYNTLDVLLACGLIKKHHFIDNVTFYEKIFGYPLHYHFVCTQCKNVTEFLDERILQVAQEHSEGNSFVLNDLNLNLMGICSDCQKE